MTSELEIYGINSTCTWAARPTALTVSGYNYLALSVSITSGWRFVWYRRKNIVRRNRRSWNRTSGSATVAAVTRFSRLRPVLSRGAKRSVFLGLRFSEARQILLSEIVVVLVNIVRFGAFRAVEIVPVWCLPGWHRAAVLIHGDDISCAFWRCHPVCWSGTAMLAIRIADVLNRKWIHIEWSKNFILLRQEYTEWNSKCN